MIKNIFCRIFSFLFIIIFTSFSIFLTFSLIYFWFKISLPCTFLRSIFVSKINKIYLNDFFNNAYNDVIDFYTNSLKLINTDSLVIYFNKLSTNFFFNNDTNFFILIDFYTNYLININYFYFILFFINFIFIKLNLYQSIFLAKFFNKIISYEYNVNNKNIFQNLHNFKKYFIIINFFFK